MEFRLKNINGDPVMTEIFKKLKPKEGTRLCRSTKIIFDTAEHWRTQFRFYEKKLIFICTTEKVSLNNEKGESYERFCPTETIRFHFEEIVVTIKESDFDLKNFPQKLLTHLTCYKLRIAVAHPFMSAFRAVDIENLYKRLQAKKLYLHCVPLEGDMTIAPLLAFYSYAVFNAIEIRTHLARVPNSPYICLDIGGRPSNSEFLQNIFEAWRNSSLMGTKWIKLCLYTDSKDIFDENAVKREYEDFLNRNEHSIVKVRTSIVEDCKPAYVIKLKDGPRGEALIVFSKQNNDEDTTITGLYRTKVHFIPNYNDTSISSQGYDLTVFDC